MIFWIILIVMTVVLPLIVLIWHKNFKTVLVCFLPWLAYTYYLIHPQCNANPYSEACTWGYVNYAMALAAGSVLYLSVSLIQFVFGYLKKAKSEL